MSADQPRKPAGTPAGGEFANKTGSAPCSSLATAIPAQRKFAVPPALSEWSCAGQPLQERLDALGWESANFVRVTGDQEYDDQNYFTPTYEFAVRGDTTIRAAMDAAFEEWARLRVFDESDDEGSQDEVERLVDDYKALNNMSGDDDDWGPSNDLLAKHGVQMIYLPSKEDPFENVHADEVM